MACACSFNKEWIVYRNQRGIRNSPIEIKRKVCSLCIRTMFCKDTHHFPPEDLAKQHNIYMKVVSQSSCGGSAQGICIPCFEACAQKWAQPRTAEQERTGVVMAASSAHSIPTFFRYELWERQVLWLIQLEHKQSPETMPNTASSLCPADGSWIWCIFPLENLARVLWVWACAGQDGIIYTESMERRLREALKG